MIWFSADSLALYTFHQNLMRHLRYGAGFLMSSTRQIRPNVPNIFLRDCSLACNGILPTKMEQRSITRWLLSLLGGTLMVDLERRIGSGWNDRFPNLLLTSSGIRGCSRRYVTSSRNPWFSWAASNISEQGPYRLSVAAILKECEHDPDSLR